MADLRQIGSAHSKNIIFNINRTLLENRTLSEIEKGSILVFTLLYPTMMVGIMSIFTVRMASRIPSSVLEKIVRLDGLSIYKGVTHHFSNDLAFSNGEFISFPEIIECQQSS